MLRNIEFYRSNILLCKANIVSSFALTVMALGILFFTGCANKTSSNPNGLGRAIEYVYLSEDDGWPDERLEKTFSDYWSKRFVGSYFEDIFAYEAPHFQEMVNFSRYDVYLDNMPKGKILRIEIASFIRATKYLYEIPINIVFQSRDGREHSMSMRDRWVFVADKWHHVLRDPLAFPGIG